jgi:hypothetical protein
VFESYTCASTHCNLCIVSKKKQIWCGGNRAAIGAIGRQSGRSVIFHQKIPFLTQCKGSTGRKLLCLSYIHVLASTHCNLCIVSKKKTNGCGGNRAAIGRAAIGRQSGGSGISHQIPFLAHCKGSTGRKQLCLSHIHVLIPIATSVSCQRRNKLGGAAGRQSGGNRAAIGRQSGGNGRKCYFPPNSFLDSMQR